MLPFAITFRDHDTAARAGELATPHGVVRTPAFMPVGTAGTVKGIAAWELARLAPEIVLANTYHLLLRPGVELIERLGGLHRLMGWQGPILTDSGGYQVHSLATRRTVDDDGVTFQSHLDGSSHRLEPAGAVDAQARFGVDIAMVLDECLPHDADRSSVERAAERTVGWALRGLRQASQRRQGGWAGGLFGIQQGGANPEIRRRCGDALAEHPFDGFAVGGLAVGEPQQQLRDSVAAFAPLLPADRPRYLMGVGYPEDLLHAVACGVDLFDCVLPTRSARTGKLFTSRGELNIKNNRHADDDRPPDPDCPCPTCATYSRGALRHLYVAREATSVVLLTVHNLTFFLSLMRGAREAIIAGRYSRFRTRVELARRADAG
ncbi:MAG TPA: tRNA guanosine(34) transglycosylase Tgt [Thermoanaerobaculales bacterium]|nr:tRNA guanosine(34) transglycosylase Tgt [Thermoanaerobaculales bacterium]